MEQVDLAEEPDPEENNKLVDPAGFGSSKGNDPAIDLICRYSRRKKINSIVQFHELFENVSSNTVLCTTILRLCFLKMQFLTPSGNVKKA